MNTNRFKLLSKVCVLALLAAFSFCMIGCDDDNEKESTEVQINILYPATEQGDIVNIPIDTPIKFHAEAEGNTEGKMTWWLEQDRKYRPINEFYTFKENGLYKVNFHFSAKPPLEGEKSFIWVNVVGKVITNIEHDEVGCSVVESNDQIHIITKHRKAYLNNGVVYSQIKNGEITKTTNLPSPNRILDTELMNDGSILYQCTNGLLKHDNASSTFQFNGGSDYYTAHIKEDVSGRIDVIGVLADKEQIIWEQRNLNGKLLKKKTLDVEESSYYRYKTYDDAIFTDDNSYLYLQVEKENGEDIRNRKLYIGSLKSGDQTILEDDSNDLRNWNEGKFIKVDSEFMLINCLGGEFANNVFKLDEEYTFDWSRSFNNLECIEAPYLFEDDDTVKPYDNKMWGWKNKNGYVFITQNKIIRVNEENYWTEVKDFLKSNSIVKIDAAWKSNNSVLILTSTKKFNEYGYFNKRYCTLYRLNLKGEFIDL